MQKTELSVKEDAMHLPAERDQDSPVALLRKMTHEASQPQWRVIIPAGLAVGWLLLFGYFHQIRHTPPELGGMLVYAALACAWLAAIWGVITVFLFGSTTFVLALGVSTKEWQLFFFGQLSSVLFFIAFILLTSDLGVQGYGAVVLLAAIATLAVAVVRMYLSWSGFQSALTLLASAYGGLVLLLGGIYLFFFLLGYAKTVDFYLMSRMVALAFVLLLAVALNTLAVVNRVDARWFWPGSAAITAAAILWLSGNGYVLGTVAAKLGLRLDKAELMVPEKTCKLVVSMLRPDLSAGTLDQLECAAAMNSVHADVHLRWSGQWLLAVQKINGVEIDEHVPRLTIPDEGVQLVLRDHATRGAEK